VAQLEAWLRSLPPERARLLHMRPEDLQAADIGADWVAQFPDRLEVNGNQLPLRYHFAPGDPDDGVTLSVPVTILGQLSPGLVDRLVPGLLREKATLLLKGLPKALRRQLVPIPDFAERCLQVLPVSDAPLVQTLGATLKQLSGIHVPEDAWQPEALPDHLRMRIRLLDESGQQEIAASRDLAALQRDFGARARAAPGRESPVADGAASPMTDWEGGALPAETTRRVGRLQVRVFPALVDCGDHVERRVLDSLAGAREAHRAGLRRLLLLRESAALRNLKRNIRGLQAMRLHYAKAPPDPVDPLDPGRPQVELLDQLVALAVDRAFLDDPWAVRDHDAFERCRAAGRPRLGPALLEVSERVGTVLELAHGLRSRLAATRQASWRAAVADMQGQLDRLVFQGFVERVDWSHLGEYPRYLKALALRLDKLPGVAARDAQRMAEMAALQEDWLRRWREAGARGQADPRLEEIRWLLEELRVSLFAQELGTALPVSVKRVRRRWEDLGL
jgi:ATP-dependent helicase HrpA